MRWRLLGLFFFAVAGAVAWLFWVRPEAEVWLKAKLETVLAERFGQDVHLDSLAVHPLLLRVAAEGVRVGPAADPLFTCQRWTFHTSAAAESGPFSFFLLTLARSEVDHPKLRVSAMGEHPFALTGGWWRKLPLHHLVWKNASLQISAGSYGSPLSLSNMKGIVHITPAGFYFDTHGDSVLGEFMATARGTVSVKRGERRLDVNGGAQLKNAPLAFFSERLPAGFGRWLGRGDLSVDVSIKDPGNDSLKLRDAMWSARVHFSKAIWFPPGALPKDRGIPVNGAILLTERRVDFNSLQLFGSLDVSGSVTTGPEGRLSLSWKGNPLRLGDAAESGVNLLRSLPPRGVVGTEGRVTGTLAHPEAEWTAELKEVGFPGFLLPDLSMTGDWKNDRFFLKTEGNSGRLDLSGTLGAAGSATGRAWTLRASNLDLASLAQRNGWPRVRGLLNGSCSLVWDESGAEGRSPNAEGTLRIDDFAWGVHRETAPVMGRLTLDREGVRVHGAQKTFDLEIRRSSGVWRVDQLTYEAGGLRLWGRGFLLDVEGNVQLEGGLTGLNLLDVPPLAKRFPSVEGRVAMEGRLHGRWGDPVFTGTIRAENVRWRPGGLLHQGDADLRGGRGGLTVARFRWGDQVRGEGAWFFGKGGRLSMEVDKASGEELFDFFSASGSIGGVYSGKVTLAKGDQPGWEGWARMEGANGHWGTAAFEKTKGVVYFRGPQVELESLEMTQKKGTFRASGSARLRPLNPAFPGTVWEWRAGGELAHFAAGAVEMSGAWTAEGNNRPREGTGEGVWRGENVAFQEESGPPAFLGPVRTIFSWTPTRWRVEDLTTGQGVRAQGEMDKDGKRLTGQVRIKDMALSSFFPRLFMGSDVRFGLVSGTGTLAGSWSDPRVELGAVLTGAGWKDLSVEGNVHASWKKRWEVPRLSLTFVNKVGAWTGSLDGSLSSAGAPEGSESTLVLGGRFQRAEEAPYRWQSRLTLSGTTATVEEALLTTGEGRWRLHAGSTLSKGENGQWNYRFKNDLRNIHVGPLQLFGGLNLDGKIRLGERAVTGRIGAESLWINQRIFDQNIANFRLTPEALVLTRMPQSGARTETEKAGVFTNKKGQVVAGTTDKLICDEKMPEFSVESRDPTGDFGLMPLEGAASFVQGRVRLDRWPQTFFENLTIWDSGRRILVLAGELGPGLWDFSLQGWGLQAETLLTLADFDWPISGPWTVKVRGRGSLNEPEVQAEIFGGPGRIGPLPYDRLDAQAHWVGEWVDVSGLRLSRRKGYLLSGEGRFPMRAGRDPADPDAETPPPFTGEFRLTEGHLGVLKDIWPLCRSAKGGFSGDVRVELGATSPRMTGSLRVWDGRMDLESYAPRVRELNGEITFQNDRARVEHARARVGPGWIEMAGDIGMNGRSPVEYDLSVQSDGSRGVAVEVPQLSVPPGPLLGRFSFFSEKLKGISYGEPRVNLRVKGPHGRHMISGSAVLEGTHFTYPPAKDGFSGIPGPAWWRNFWRLAAWDIEFKTGKETWYRNEYLNVRLDGGLHLVGQPGTWTLNGRVGSTEGALNYLGQIFQVKRGDFEVVTDVRPAMGPGGILPYVSGEAERTVTTVDARGLATDDTISMVVDRALLGEIQPRFVSRNNPDLKSDRVAMKALGLSSEQQGTPAERDQLFRAGLVQLVGSSAAPLANRLAQKLGIGMISPIYEPPETQETAPTAAPLPPRQDPSAKASPLTDYLRGAGASARIRITDRVSGVYKVKLDEAKNQTFFRDQIELIVRLKGSVYVRASSELDTQSLLGQPPERRAVLENQWRFGLPKKKKKEVSEPVK